MSFMKDCLALESWLNMGSCAMLMLIWLGLKIMAKSRFGSIKIGHSIGIINVVVNGQVLRHSGVVWRCSGSKVELEVEVGLKVEVG